MKGNAERSMGSRVLGSVAALTLIVAVIYVLVAGINLISSLVILSALGGLAGPAIAVGDGFVECVVGIFEMFIEGIALLFEAIGNFFGSLFG